MGKKEINNNEGLEVVAFENAMTELMDMSKKADPQMRQKAVLTAVNAVAAERARATTLLGEKEAEIGKLRRELIVADGFIQDADTEIARLKNELGDPHGVIAHADAITNRAETAEARVKVLGDLVQQAVELVPPGYQGWLTSARAALEAINDPSK